MVRHCFFQLSAIFQDGDSEIFRTLRLNIFKSLLALGRLTLFFDRRLRFFEVFGLKNVSLLIIFSEILKKITLGSQGGSKVKTLIRAHRLAPNTDRIRKKLYYYIVTIFFWSFSIQLIVII